MKEVMLSARRGAMALLVPQAALALFATAAAWTLANKLLGWIVLGPALLALFRLALGALHGRRLDVLREHVDLLDDLPVALVAGVFLGLPFKLWAMLDDLDGVVFSLMSAAPAANVTDVLTTPGIPVLASAALFVHFGFHVLMFPVIAERHCGFMEALDRSRAIADQPGAGGSRLRGLGRHLLATSAVLALVLLAARAWYLSFGAGGLFMTLVTPIGVVVTAAWYLQLTGRPADELPVPAELAESGPDDADAGR